MDSPLLATSATIGGVITGKEILDLPLIDRAPQVSPDAGPIRGRYRHGRERGRGPTLSLLTTVNGIRSAILASTVRAASIPSVDSKCGPGRRGQVVSSPADARIGPALGQVQMIVRSGTNQFHGSAVDGLRNTALNANTFWNNLQVCPPGSET